MVSVSAQFLFDGSVHFFNMVGRNTAHVVKSPLGHGECVPPSVKG